MDANDNMDNSEGLYAMKNAWNPVNIHIYFYDADSNGYPRSNKKI